MSISHSYIMCNMFTLYEGYATFGEINKLEGEG